MTRTEIENAVYAAVKLAAPDLLAYFERPNSPTPDAYPYATIRIEGIRGGDGIPWTRNAVVLEADPGEDLEISHVEPGHFNVSLHTYSEDTHGDSCANALLEAIRAALTTSVTRAPLSAVGIVLNTRGAVVDVGEEVEGGWRGHAQMDLEMSVAIVATERTTWIEKVRKPRITSRDGDTVSGATDGDLPS